MNWPKFFIRYFMNILSGAAVGVIALGVLGWILAGKQGLSNGVNLGLLFGLLAGLTVGALLALNTRYWGDFAGRLAGWWVKHREETSEEDHSDQRTAKQDE